ncbi:MAG: PDZ domain-containing protein [Isosphaeraceae bacterium]
MNLLQRSVGVRWALPAASAAILLLPAPASAQRARQSKEGAAVVVDGVVREVFRSQRQTQVDYLVQIEVQRSEYGRSPADPRRVQAPAPGDQIYVHVHQPAEGQGRFGAAGHNAIPGERATVRAYLYARAQGGWEGALPDWFDQANTGLVGRGPNDPEPAPGDEPVPDVTAAPAPAPTAGADESIAHRLGLRAEQVQVSGRLVLKVLDVVADSPAGKAGIEVGDAIIGVNGGFITDLEQLEEVVTRGGPVATFAVLDVRSGKTTPVKVDVSSLAVAKAPEPRPEPQPVPTRTLGVKTEQVRMGQRTAGRVTDVQNGSVAEKAGIERGDVLTEADGTPLTDLAALQAAVQRGGAVMTFKVYDSRTRREVPVPVHFDGAAAATAPAGGTAPPVTIPSPAPAPGSGTSSRALGLVTEAGTVDLLPVVKVVQVQPGSPAEKAGLEVGDAIVGLNDKVIFAPDLLDEALKTAGNAFTLSVLDVKTGKKTPVKISLQ